MGSEKLHGINIKSERPLTDAVGPLNLPQALLSVGSLQPPLQHQRSRVLSRLQGRWLACSLWIAARAWRCGSSVCYKTHFSWIHWYGDPKCASWIRFWCFQSQDSQTSARKVHSYLVDSLFRLMKRAVQTHFSKSSQRDYLKEAEGSW